jgi:hypothetical protein
MIMGGKSRKTGGVSQKLIQQLKSGSLNQTSKTASNETKSSTTTLFTRSGTKSDKS